MAGGRKTPEETLAELEQRKAQIDARIKATAAKVRSAERKKDTRRKVIAGALALEHMAHDPAFKKAFEKLISEQVKRPEDRALFSHFIA